jgi:hypothetical protein
MIASPVKVSAAEVVPLPEELLPPEVPLSVDPDEEPLSVDEPLPEPVEPEVVPVSLPDWAMTLVLAAELVEVW